MVKKALLLYSGGLDTSVMIKWLQEEMNYEVSTLTLDIGQEKNDLDSIALKAKKLGANNTITQDVKDTFANEYVSRGIISDALYQGKYPLSTSLARPLMAKKAVEVAHELECNTIVHGCTGKGNDQVRFDVSIRSLDDSIKVIAPVRDMNMNRDEEIQFAEKHGIEVPYNGKYSVDENLWGRSVEGSEIEDITGSVPFDAYRWVIPPEEAKDSADIVEIEFNRGIPVSLDGLQLGLKEIIAKLSVISGKNGIGSIDMVEDRVVGIKSHEFYECPAAITVLAAHKYLESAVLNKKELALKSIIDTSFSEYAYTGLWYDPVMEHIQNFEESINNMVNGTVRLKLYKGNIIYQGVSSENAVYDVSLSSYAKGQTFDQSKSPGFIYVFGNETIVTRKARSQTTPKPVIKVS